MAMKKTVDFFSSPIGLGHITRDIAIAENLRDTRISFATGSGAAKILNRLDYKVRDVYSPPSFVVKGGTLKNPAKWLWRYYQYYRDCKDIAQWILDEDRPDVVISDEDFASLSVAQDMKIPTILITDVLETHFTKGLASWVEKKMNKSMQQIIKKCDVVIFPEDGNNEENITRTGPIVRQTRHTRDELREKFSFKRRTILVSIGGTDAGIFLIDAALEAISKIKQEKTEGDIDTVLVSGPAVNQEFKNVRNLGFVENLHELIFAADVLVSLAGKSTMDEAAAYGTPSIFIPIKGHFEQEDNARGRGFVFEDIKRLDALIAEKLKEKRTQVNTDGTATASDIIKKFINGNQMVNR